MQSMLNINTNANFCRMKYNFENTQKKIKLMIINAKIRFYKFMRFITVCYLHLSYIISVGSQINGQIYFFQSSDIIAFTCRCYMFLKSHILLYDDFSNSCLSTTHVSKHLGLILATIPAFYHTEPKLGRIEYG